MVQIDNFLELLLATAESTVKITKDTLLDIRTCLKNAQEKIEFLQLESKLQREELLQRSHDSELVFVPNNPIFESKVDYNQQPEIVQITEPSTRVDLNTEAEFQYTLPKPIIRHWEKLVHNKHKIDLGYDKDVSFRIPDYLKTIQFQSVGFLHDSAPSDFLVSAPLHNNNNKMLNANIVIELAM